MDHSSKETHTRQLHRKQPADKKRVGKQAHCVVGCFFLLIKMIIRDPVCTVSQTRAKHANTVLPGCPERMPRTHEQTPREENDLPH